MFKLDDAIDNWLKGLRKHRAFGDGEIREMDLHIRDHIEDLMSEGLSGEEAFLKAVNEFGEVSPMANEEFSTQKRRHTIKSLIFSTMLNNYTKTSYRRLLRHPVSSVINILGLAIAIAICIMVYAFGYWVDNLDQFHENKQKVYLTTSYINRNGSMEQWGLSPTPLGEMMLEDFPQINKMCRIVETSAVVKLDDKVFHERMNIVDAAYFDMFTFPLTGGQPSSLKSHDAIILSANMASKYFGNNDPIGSELTIIFNGKEKKIFNVTGVAKEFPANHFISFDFLINYQNVSLTRNDYDPNNWNDHIRATLIKVNDPKHLKTIEEGMAKYKKIQNSVVEDWKIDSFKFEQLATLFQNSPKINKTISSRSYNTNKRVHAILSIISFFMLALACINYINISIATAAKRLKEIALRKTIGANRAMVIVQHLTENIMTSVLALFLGLLLGKYFLIPWFEIQNGFNTGFSLLESDLWIYLAVLTIATSLLSGLYPAIYISKFESVNIFKGKLKFGRGNPVTKFFLGFQLILACILIVCAVMFTQNISFLQKRSRGYNPSGLLYVQVENKIMYDQLSNNLEKYPYLEDVSGGQDHIGVQKGLTVFKKNDKQYEVAVFKVASNYPSMMGLKFVDGRDFIHKSNTDRLGLIVNEKFAKNLGPDAAIGEEFMIDTLKYNIIGIVNDFNHYTFSHSIEPMVFQLLDNEEPKNLVFKVNQFAEIDALNNLKSEWESLFPDIPFRGGFQEDVWGDYFETLEWHGEFWQTIAIITLFMSGLGLFGLVSLNVSGRVKELSIRKLLGARISHLGAIILGDYTILFIVSLGIGAPLSYYLVGILFDSIYPYHVPANMLSLAIAAMILLSVLFLVVVSQLVQVGKANPVDGLKEE